MSPEERVKTIT